jgi:hypothetical protein
MLIDGDDTRRVVRFSLESKILASFDRLEGPLPPVLWILLQDPLYRMVSVLA